jgi:hypothetical protein
MLGQKLARVGGGLVLCRLSDHVRTVIEISGLSGHLALFDTRDEALAHLSSVDESQQGRASKVSALAARLLGRPGDSGPPQHRATDPPPGLSRLSREVAQLLAIDYENEPDRLDADTDGSPRDR